MTVENSDVFDAIGVETATGFCILTITDHLDWDDFAHHEKVLREKIRMYVFTVLSGGLLQIYPTGRGNRVVIDLICQFPPGRKGEALIKEIAADVRKNSIGFRASVFKPASSIVDLPPPQPKALSNSHRF